jgi:hypothetical protein
MVDNPDIANPDIANPDIANPDIANPDIANATVANPDIANPDIANPDIANPDIANPDIANPDIANPDIANYSVTDVTWTVKNKGNTTAAYAFRAKLGRTLPPGAKLQLIVRRVYIAPQANPLNECGPPVPAVQNQVLVNIPNPNLNADLTASFDPADYQDNASFYLLPADEGRVTLRLFCPKGDGTCPATLAQARSLAAARVEAQAPNNCPTGVTNGNCAVNGFNPDDIYDTTPPATACSVTTGATTSDCSQGPFYVQGSAVVRLTPADSVGVKTTSCTIDGQPCAGLTFTVAGEGTHAVTFGSTDYSGNSETPQTVAIHVDTTAPVVSGLVFPGAPNLGQWISAPSITGTVNATDSSPLTVSCSDGLNGTTVNGLNITVAGDGAHHVVCSVTDGAGNATVASATVKLDATSPTVSVPTVAVVAEATSAAGAAVSYSVSGADTLSGVAVVCTPPAASTFPLGVPTLVSCTATDGAGNTATATFTVSVRDTTPPSVVLNGSPTILFEGGSPFVDPGATATDLVDGTVSVTVAGTVLAGTPGTYTLTYTATDARGNSASVPRMVTVADTRPPSVVLNGSPTMTIEAGSAFADPGATASDVVSGTIPVIVTGTVNTAVPGAYTLTYTATDGAGNSAFVRRTVTVVDSTPPTVTLIGSAAMTIEAGSAFADPGATATDSVAGSLPVTVTGAVLTGVVGTYTLTYSATDPSGNKGTAMRSVTVRDTVAPTVTATVSPLTIWSPNGAMVPVTLSGVVTDAGSGPGTVRYSVKDEYGTVQPIGGPIAANGDGSYSFQVVLQASRKGSDKNGRTYTFTVTATDKAGMTATKVLVVTAVEHNQ